MLDVVQPRIEIRERAVTRGAARLADRAERLPVLRLTQAQRRGDAMLIEPGAERREIVGRGLEEHSDRAGIAEERRATAVAPLLALPRRDQRLVGVAIVLRDQRIELGRERGV